MPMLSIRSVGVSHLIEGRSEAGVDQKVLLTALAARYDEAVAPIGGDSEDEPDGILVDRKSVTRDDLIACLGSILEGLGFFRVSIAEEPLAGLARMIVHYHR